jgi:hypothetical protein
MTESKPISQTVELVALLKQNGPLLLEQLRYEKNIMRRALRARGDIAIIRCPKKHKAFGAWAGKGIAYLAGDDRIVGYLASFLRSRATEPSTRRTLTHWLRWESGIPRDIAGRIAAKTTVKSNTR